MKNYLLHQQQLMLIFGKHTLLAYSFALTTNIESLSIKDQKVAKEITQLSAEWDINVLTAQITTLDYKFTKLENEFTAAQTTMAYLHELVQNFASLQKRSNALLQ